MSSDGVKLTPAEAQHKRTCEDGLKVAKAAMQKRDAAAGSVFYTFPANSGHLPWERALKMERDIKKIGTSSVRLFGSSSHFIMSHARDLNARLGSF